MSASTLIDNLSSDYIAAFNALLSNGAPKRIVVYVEGYDDIAFWRTAFDDYETDKIQFDIQTSTHKGKTGALERSNHLLSLNVGEHMVICVDSDYDYILPVLSPQSTLINENPYIFQTYSYSIENLQCFAEGLHNVCVQSSKIDKKIIDLKKLIEDFSKIIYPLFLWNVFFRKQNDHNTFTISDFCEIIKLTDKVDVLSQFSEAVDGLKSRVDSKITELAHSYSSVSLNEIATELNNRGVNEDNAYLFIQGHTLKNNLVLMVLKSIYDFITKEKIEQIKIQFADNPEHLPNEVNQYRNSRIDIVATLNLHTEYKDCFLYQKIKNDLNNYIQSLH